MRITRLFPLLFVLAFVSTSTWAVDYKPDQTFQPQFQSDTTIYDVLVQGDGKVMVVGQFSQVNGAAKTGIVRLNPDGTTDPTFVSGLNQGSATFINSIQLLSNGKFLITGAFSIGSQVVSYARLNSDGSLDPTMALAYTDRYSVAPLPDGKFIACGQRTINNETYQIAHRLNSDGSVDPSFRVTLGEGLCVNVKALPSGKILLSGQFTSGGQPIKPLYRLNSDGSQDLSFDAPLANGSNVNGVTVLPDGKLLISSGGVKRLLPDGGLDLTISNCAGVLLPLQDGSVFMSGCRKWPVYGPVYAIAKVFPNGVMDSTLDNNRIDYVKGLRDGGNGSLYIFGGFSNVDNMWLQNDIYRAVPNLTPKKAKFDFDGDGRSDIAVYRPSNGYWYLYQSTAGVAFYQWGLPGDKPAAAHFDNDRKTDIAVIRDGSWHANSSLYGYRYIIIGGTGDKPMPGDFEDYPSATINQDDFAVYGPQSGVPRWYLREAGSVIFPYNNQITTNVGGESLSDKPVVGDFDGDSRDEIGYFRDGVWYSRDYAFASPINSFQWGKAGDIPVPGDYDGDRQTDYAIFRPSKGTWSINCSTAGPLSARFGQIGDIPVPADYDGDGKTDIAVYRNGEWWQYLSATGTIALVNWGLAGDIPIPAQTQ